MSDSNFPFSNNPAGEAFLVDPESQEDLAGVLVLHSWWGLNDWVRDFCRNLSQEGYTVLAPDLFARSLPTTEAEGEAVLAEVDPDELSGLVMSSAHTLRAVTANPDRPIGIIGFSMGASMAFWLSARIGTAVGAVVAFYGSQSIDFDDSASSYQGHFGTNDHMVSEDDRVATESFVRLGGKSTEFHTYEGARHWFFEDGSNYDQDAHELAWDRTKVFLADNLKVHD